MIDCVAGILVGGASRRMGTCKALVNFRGKPMIQHIAEAAAEVASEVVLLGDEDVAVDGLRGLARLRDASFGQGPLRGLHSLLEFAGGRWTILLACDMPLLRAEILIRIAKAWHDGVDAVAFARLERPGEFHVCCAGYHPRAFSAVQAELTTGAGKIQSVLGRVRTVSLMPSPEEEKLLLNVNTPKDLEGAKTQKM